MFPPASRADKEVKLEINKLPKAVLDAANKEAGKGVEWKQASMLEEDGETWYEVVGVVGKAPKRLITLEIDEDGEVFHVEEMIDPAKVKEKVPANVLETFTAKYKLTKDIFVFEVRDDGKVTQYDFLITRPAKGPAKKGKGGKKKDKAKAKDEEDVTVSITPDGKLVEEIDD
jgi:hypothetical protein